MLECFLIHVAGWFSGMQTQIEFSAGMFIRAALVINSVKSGGRNGIGQKERSSWITAWMTLADPMGHLK